MPTPERVLTIVDSLYPAPHRTDILVEAPFVFASPEIAAATVSALGVTGGSGGGTWGAIAGTLLNQTDLADALALKAPLDSAALTGTPTAPTASGGTNTTQIATTQFVVTALTAKADATGTTTALALKAPLDSAALTGTPTAPTASGGTNTTQIATTQFVTAALTAKASLVSPVFTGTPTAPTATTGTNTTQIATTQFVTAGLADKQPLSSNLTALSAFGAPSGALVGTSDGQTLTNKELGSGTKITLGSDAAGDLYYRHSTGVLQRLPIGSEDDVLHVAADGVPEWAAPSGGGGGSGSPVIIATSVACVDATNGNDTTGTGHPEAPYQTVQKALDTAHTVVYMAPGAYAGFSFAGTGSAQTLSFIGCGEGISSFSSGCTVSGSGCNVLMRGVSLDGDFSMTATAGSTGSAGVDDSSAGGTGGTGTSLSGLTVTGIIASGNITLSAGAGGVGGNGGANSSGDGYVGGNGGSGGDINVTVTHCSAVGLTALSGAGGDGGQGGGSSYESGAGGIGGNGGSPGGGSPKFQSCITTTSIAGTFGTAGSGGTGGTGAFGAASNGSAGGENSVNATYHFIINANVAFLNSAA